MNQDLTNSQLKFNWRLTKSELKLNYDLNTSSLQVMDDIQMNEPRGINICDIQLGYNFILFLSCSFHNS